MRSQAGKRSLAVLVCLALLLSTLLSGCAWLSKRRVKSYLDEIKLALETADQRVDQTDYLSIEVLRDDTQETLNEAKRELEDVKEGYQELGQALSKLEKTKTPEECKKLHNYLTSLLQGSRDFYRDAETWLSYAVDVSEMLREILREMELARDKIEKGEPKSPEEAAAVVNKAKAVVDEAVSKMQTLNPPKEPSDSSKLHSDIIALLKQDSVLLGKYAAAVKAQNDAEARRIAKEGQKIDAQLQKKIAELDKLVLEAEKALNLRLSNLRKDKSKMDEELARLKTKYKLK